MIIDQIEKDLVETMKAKDEAKTSVLRMLKSAIHNWQIASQRQPQEADVLQIIQKEIKSRNDSITMYQKGGREDLAQKEKNEIEILKKYLPEQASEEVIREKVKAKITEVKASGIQDMGKVMGPIMAELKGRADGATVSRIVKEELSP
jgi:uncharacterized protein YqeY